MKHPIETHIKSAERDFIQYLSKYHDLEMALWILESRHFLFKLRSYIYKIDPKLNEN